MTNDKSMEDYAREIEPLLPLAKRAFGSKDIVSPQHDASRAYTKLLVEFHDGGGSLLDLAKRLDVTYAGMNRRVATAKLPASPKRSRKKFSDVEYNNAVVSILHAKSQGTKAYHEEIYTQFEKGMSMARLAKELGLSSANPLYFAANAVRISRGQGE